MRSASTIASLVASRSTGPSSPFLGFASGSAFGAEPPLLACSALARAGASAPGRSRMRRSLSSSVLMLGTGHLRLALEVVDCYLGRNTDSFIRPFQLDRIIHNWEVARQLGVLDPAAALLAGQRRVVWANQRQPAHWIDQPA